MYIALLFVAAVAAGFFAGIKLLETDTPASRFTSRQDFSLVGDMAERELLAGGWSAQEPWGVWSDGERAALNILVPASVVADVEITLEGRVFLIPGRHERQVVRVKANGEMIDKWVFGGAPRMAKSFLVPRHIAIKKRPISIELHIDHPQSPAELGLGQDKRRLALGLEKVSVQY